MDSDFTSLSGRATRRVSKLAPPFYRENGAAMPLRSVTEASRDGELGVTVPVPSREPGHDAGVD
jgi:hypothetical protein